MAEPAPKISVQQQGKPPAEPIVIRRFERPDLAQHGGWLSARLLTVYPHLTQQTLYGWLDSIIYNNEFMFLYQPHSVGLAQLATGHTLAPKPVVHERFVFAEAPEYVDEAANFYKDFHRWAKAMDAEVIVMSDMTDVPADKIKQQFGRVFERQQVYAKV